jgi:MFS family permease
VFLTFSIYIGSAIYTPGLMGVMAEFGVSQVAATLGLTLFVAGYGLGPLLWSPLSEIPQFGRNPIYIATLRKSNSFSLSVITADNSRSGVCSLPGTCLELRHVACLSFPHRVLWLSRARYGRCDDSRYVQTVKASVWSQHMGHRRCLRTLLVSTLTDIYKVTLACLRASCHICPY